MLSQKGGYGGCFFASTFLTVSDNVNSMKKDKLILIVILVLFGSGLVIYINWPQPPFNELKWKTINDYDYRFLSLIPTESSLPHRGYTKEEDYDLCIKDKNYTKGITDPRDFCAWHARAYEYSEENYNTILLFELSEQRKKEQ